jgi:hypothetical protein
VPLTTGCDGKGDREKHDSNNTDVVRYHGGPTGESARIRPDDADIVPTTSRATIAARPYRIRRLVMTQILFSSGRFANRNPIPPGAKRGAPACKRGVELVIDRYCGGG